MDAEILKKEFVPKYIAEGDNKFYKFLLMLALNKLVLIINGAYKGSLPHLELLEWHDQSIILYRREGEEVYLEIARLFRKSANKVYRIMLKKNMIKYNSKFLNLI